MNTRYTQRTALNKYNLKISKNSLSFVSRVQSSLQRKSNKDNRNAVPSQIIASAPVPVSPPAPDHRSSVPAQRMIALSPNAG